MCRNWRETLKNNEVLFKKHSFMEEDLEMLAEQAVENLVGVKLDVTIETGVDALDTRFVLSKTYSPPTDEEKRITSLNSLELDAVGPETSDKILEYMFGKNAEMSHAEDTVTITTEVQGPAAGGNPSPFTKRFAVMLSFEEPVKDQDIGTGQLLDTVRNISFTSTGKEVSPEELFVMSLD